MKSIHYLLLACAVTGVSFGCSKSKEAQLPPAVKSAATNALSANELPVDFALQWAADKTYLLRIETIQSWEVKEPAPKEPSKQTLSMAHDYAVSPLKELPGGGCDLDWEFMAQKVQFQMGSAMMLSFDSAQDPAQDAGNPAAPMLRQLIGGRIRCQMDGDGRVLKVDGFNDLQKRMTKGQPWLRSMVQSVFSETNFRQLVGFAEVMQKGQPQKVGDQWPVKLELPDPAGTQILNLTCTFKDWEPCEERRCARIEFDGTITSQPPASGAVLATTIEEGKVSGRILFDPVLGMVVTSGSDLQMMVKTTLPKPAATQCHVTTNVRLVRVTDR